MALGVSLPGMAMAPPTVSAADPSWTAPASGGGQVSVAPTSGQQHQQRGQQRVMRPVPKYPGASVRGSQPPGQASQTGRLRWRTSQQVADRAEQPPAVRATAARHDASTAAMASGAESSSRQQASEFRSATAAGPSQPGVVTAVRPVQFEAPNQRDEDRPAAEPSAGVPQTLQDDDQDDAPLPNFFADPFGEAPPPRQPRTDVPPEDTAAEPQPTMPQPDPTTPRPPSDLDTFNDLRRSPEQQPSPMPHSPDRRDDQPEDPFADELRRRQRMPADDLEPSPFPRSDDDPTLVQPASFSCDDFRTSIAEATIQRVSLDISPPFRPDVLELDEFRKAKRRFAERQEIRDWTSIGGLKLGRGRLRDMAYEKVVIETEFGTIEELPVHRISEADLAYISAQWGLPQECLMDQPEYRRRNWVASSVTWKASNAVHKPLYFQDINLERYGHTTGPVLQPVISSAHFFANIATMPYQMGVHLPSECQYALGYYRPGSCAPWITQPVPLSLRGALFQAGTLTTTGLLVPGWP